MLRRVLRLVGALLLLVVVAAVLGLGWAHVAIRRERTPLPSVDEVAALAHAEDPPVRAAYIDTARQPMPRSAVLDEARDPAPDTPYVMSHPSIALEWADGRVLLIDVGMTAEQARAFGRPIEWLAGAAPMEPRHAVAEVLGAAGRHVGGVVFTHLHDDHVGGLATLCRIVGPGVPVFMTEAQSERPNYTTRAGLRLVTGAECLRPTRLAGEGLLAVPGFPGVAVVHVAGHTPGSQVVIASLAGGGGRHTFAFAGDVANNVDGLLYDVPKPGLYSLLIVPEDGERLGEVRRWLRTLHERLDVTLVPAHDAAQLERSGIPAW